jgi:hypothetical protein
LKSASFVAADGPGRHLLFSEVTMLERNVLVFVHRYRAEQAVEFFPGPGVDRKAKGRYTVVGLLPMDGAIAQYRVKNKTDGHERVVWENELRSL